MVRKRILLQLSSVREPSCGCDGFFFTTHTPTFRRRIGGRPLPPPWAFTSPRLMSQVVPKPCHKRGANGLTISTHFISHYGVSKPSDFGTALQACGVSGRDWPPPLPSAWCPSANDWPQGEPAGEARRSGPGPCHLPLLRSTKWSRSARSYNTRWPILTWGISPVHPRLLTVQGLTLR